MPIKVPYLISGEEISPHNFDQGKPQWDLLPPREMEVIVKVMTQEVRKRGDESWFKAPEGKRRLLSASLDHINEYRKGEWNDPESGSPHLAHAITSLMHLLTLTLEY